MLSLKFDGLPIYDMLCSLKFKKIEQAQGQDEKEIGSIVIHRQNYKWAVLGLKM